MTTFSPESRAVLKTSMGDVTLAFLVEKAPRTCEHFVRLARQGFYDGLTFHRVIKDFIVQGGCPRGDGSGGPGFTLRAEFNDTPHVRGVVSMARGTDPHSAGSQFFFVQGDAPYLDSRYTAFARVVEGQDVVDKIASVPVTENRFRELSTPRDPVFINRVLLEGIEFDAEDLAPAPVASGAAQGQPSQAPSALAPSPPGAPPVDDDEDEDGEGDGGSEGNDYGEGEGEGSGNGKDRTDGGHAHGQALEAEDKDKEKDGDETDGEGESGDGPEAEPGAGTGTGPRASGGEGGRRTGGGAAGGGAAGSGARRRRSRRGGRRGGEGGKRGGQGS